MAFLGALAKFGMGMVHGDGNTRQCMATSVVAYKQAFGFDAPPYTYADFEESDVIVLVGSNLCIAHPIMWQRMMRNKNRPEIIVLDPRNTEAIINLAVMTGNIGRPGTGANSITGQCNAMGSRLFSNTTNLLGGHDFADPLHRRKVADVLSIDESRIPREDSWAY